MDLSSLLGGAAAIDPGRLATAVGEVFQSQGGVNGLVEKLRAGGLGSVVDSWISTGSNQPADPQQVGAALGPDTVQQVAAKSGLSVEMVLPILAAALPMIIDHLTPGGNLPKEGGVGSMDDLGGIIGGVLGGAGGPLGDLFGNR
jgi:uncharacterized protein YidB (DUF937 family)